MYDIRTLGVGTQESKTSPRQFPHPQCLVTCLINLPGKTVSVLFRTGVLPYFSVLFRNTDPNRTLAANPDPFDTSS